MIRSMTGYGRSETACGDKSLIVEIKSLNHRNLEMSVRIPNGLGELEIMIKKKIAERVSRGRVEAVLRFETGQGAAESSVLQLNMPLIRDYYAVLEQIRKELNLQDPVTLELVSSVKNGIYAAEPEYTNESVRPAIEQGVDNALSALTDMKEREGALLYRDFLDRIDSIKRWRDFLDSRSPRVIVEYRQRLTDRLKDLTTGLELDETRISQEIALMAEKTDITEELVRLDSHITQFRDLLDGTEPAGRRIDFLIQEMHREINTIGSKSSDLDISRTVIDVKTELAKLREQAQNIE
ncbi:MAG: hypothetical protein AVO39_07205 [delta proteobacterium MLS_D]|jgi:uncharacterized protein (TIGR00255 family)|nr:MAG: hypothetical protein AVO39_07205 [delta proteobacterium MLS_D]